MIEEKDYFVSAITIYGKEVTINVKSVAHFFKSDICPRDPFKYESECISYVLSVFCGTMLHLSFDGEEKREEFINILKGIPDEF